MFRYLAPPSPWIFNALPSTPTLQLSHFCYLVGKLQGPWKLPCWSLPVQTRKRVHCTLGWLGRWLLSTRGTCGEDKFSCNTQVLPTHYHHPEKYSAPPAMQQGWICNVTEISTEPVSVIAAAASVKLFVPEHRKHRLFTGLTELCHSIALSATWRFTTLCKSFTPLLHFCYLLYSLVAAGVTFNFPWCKAQWDSNHWSPKQGQREFASL